MDEHERLLLGNLLDALDRLFDHQSAAADIEALLYATARALRGSAHFPVLMQPVAALRQELRSGKPLDGQRTSALVLTDALRHYLADRLD